MRQDPANLMKTELGLIIETDRKAGAMMEQAQETCRRIEEQTQGEVMAIRLEREQKLEMLHEQIHAERAEKLERHEQKMQAAFEARKKELEEKVAENKAAWIKTITDTILHR